MAVTSGFFNSNPETHDRLYNAEEVGSLLDGIITDGILETYGDHFLVQAGSGLNVTVGSGRGWYDGTWIYNDDTITLPVEANTTGNPRYDAVVIDINKTDAVRANTIQVVTGTDSSTGPVLPSQGAHKQFALAIITVDATGSSISQVTDKREYAHNALVTNYWPVGSIFLTLSRDFNPHDTFGGQWTQLKGRFLLGCGSDGVNAGDTGGSWKHTISVNHLPSHNHTLNSAGISNADITVGFTRLSDTSPVGSIMGWADSDASAIERAAQRTGKTNYLPADYDYPYGFQGSQVSQPESTPPIVASKAAVDQVVASASSHSHNITGQTDATGDGNKIDIHPPYLGVYMWQRIS